jgi:2-desacetyl-2-hydroxyethyl bacteriochlorophyllide A dehydrogenase
MKAFVLSAPRQLQAVDIPLPEPGPNQVRVKIAYVGICGSDLEAYLGRRKPEWLGDPPMLGHEASGIIDQVGEHVSGLKVGDRVVAAQWGSFAESVVCRPESVLKLPPEIPLTDASLLEALPGMMMAATKCGITRAHDVAIVGQGLSGLLLTRVVALHGCRRLIAIDLFDEKLDIARELGATHTINASKENVQKRIEEIAPDGVDFTIMATLDGNDVPPAVEWSRFGGKIVLYGSIGPCDGIDFFRVHCKALSILKESTELSGVLERRRLWREALQLVADGLLNVERLRTHIFPLEELPAAMELRATPRPDVIHVLIENDWARERRLRGEEL